MRRCSIRLGIALLMLCSACREREPSTKDKELDVQLAQAKARQAEAEAEKAAVEARSGQATAPSAAQKFQRRPDDVAQTTVKKYAFEAFGQWSQTHPDKSCPDKLEDLSAYIDAKDINDPWGHPYVMFCGQNLPAGARGGLAVMSAGPDGRQGTDDDVKSW